MEKDDIPRTIPSKVQARLSVLTRVAAPKLEKATRILGSSSTLDVNLTTAQYALTLLAEVVDRVSNKRALAELVASVTAVAKMLDVDVVVEKELKPSAVADRMRKLSGLISDVRIFNRLWGLLGLFQWGIATFRAPPKDWVLRLIAYTQVCSNTLYQPLENIAYLGSHGILPVSRSTIGKLWLISSRLWMMHVLLDIVRLGRERMIDSIKTKEDEERWTRQAIVDCAYLPMTIHWSRQSGFLSELGVGVCGSIAGGVRLIPLWM
ncbi:hypothetical protein V1512DRAFT_258283, partial [Lipomyces arxii]|uniref:uncharacterized protein n=1 Tax=Lipomyces arxii TaxID=56418 RepID=UPI0034CED3ED